MCELRRPDVGVGGQLSDQAIRPGWRAARMRGINGGSLTAEVHEDPGDDRRLRLLTGIDVCTRECLAIDVGRTLQSEDVVRVLTRIAAVHGAPPRIYCDNGSEFQSRRVDPWAYTRKVRLELSRSGKPTDNAHIESFNCSLRNECVNIHWFTLPADAKEELEVWRTEYNESQPHKALDHRTPREYAEPMKNEAGEISG